MTETAMSVKRLIDDAILIVSTVRDEQVSERPPYASDVRRIVDRALALNFGEYVQFLERYGFLTLDRKTDLFSLTGAGTAIVSGDKARRDGMLADAKYHFVDRLQAIEKSPPKASPGVRLDGRYWRMECVGSGSLGRVWTGHQLSTDRDVAIKVFEGLDLLHRGSQTQPVRRQLELIIRRQAGVLSPFVVPILDQNSGHDEPYVVMGLAKGGNLRQLMDSGQLPPKLAIRYLFQVALGLRAAHKVGLIHRDLKPENILLDENGNAMLSDFGLTRLADSQGTMLRRAYVGYGSLGYMAPETFRQTVAPNPANDIYALGILLYEMLVGQLPGRRSAMPSEVIKGTPPELDSIFDKMTRDDLGERFSRIDEVLDALWESKKICAILDARTGPVFLEPPVTLPGLVVETRSDAAERGQTALADIVTQPRVEPKHSTAEAPQGRIEREAVNAQSPDVQTKDESPVIRGAAAAIVPISTVEVLDADVLEEKEALPVVEESALNTGENAEEQNLAQIEPDDTNLGVDTLQRDDADDDPSTRQRPQPRARTTRPKATRPRVARKTVPKKKPVPKAKKAKPRVSETKPQAEPDRDEHTGTVNSVGDSDITSNSAPPIAVDADSTRLLEAKSLPDEGKSKPKPKSPRAALPRVVGPIKTKKTAPKNDEPPSVVVDESLYDFEPTSAGVVGDDVDDGAKTAVHNLKEK